MTGHEDQQRIGMGLHHSAMGRQYNFVFPRMGTGGNPDRTLQGLPVLTLLSGTLQQLRINGQVKLDRARHGHALGPSAQITEALGLGFGLHGNQVHLRQHRPSQPGEASVAASRTL